jgi:hypothetical protein
LRQEIDRIWKILHRHESRLRTFNWEKAFNRLFKRKLRIERQRDIHFGVHLALVVDTRDPWKQNRIRWFSPTLHVNIASGHLPNPPPGVDSEIFTRIDQLEWAWPISAMGGFDDCGMTWVPPPGSTVCLLFQNGNPHSAFYIGTTWQRDKGPEDNPNWGYDIPEYRKIFKGHRKGYMVGKNDESQCLPPFNTSNYQGYDIDTTVETDLVPDAQSKTTWPHMYGWKTPEKHTFLADDGDPKCNRRWKRVEIVSSMGHYFLMKDDPYHHCGEWVNPKCKTPFTEIVPAICDAVPYFISFIDPNNLNTISFIPQPYPCQQGPENCETASETASTTADQEYLGTEWMCSINSPFPSVISAIPVDCSGVLKNLPGDFCFKFNNEGKNKYHKHKQECFPFLNDRCALNQSGMQLLARSGHTLVMDDSVEEPRERPEWERALKEFDMDGCTGVYKGRTFLRSSTGHFIELNDEEVNPKIRGPKNGIHINTACGNKISLNDHTKEGCVAGEHRGIHIRSTADHSLDFVDESNQQCSPVRDGCAKPGPYSKKAFIRMRSGYGLQLMMNDAQSQMKTDSQYLQLLAPQKDNIQRGPHVLHMQERATGSGQIFLRAGGDYIVYSYDHMVEVVGGDENPSNKLEFVSKMKVVSVKDVYYNKAKTHVFWADDYVFLLAGKDCAEDDGSSGTCVYPVVVAHAPIPEFITYMTGMKASEHVFASAIKEPDNPCEGVASDV